MRAKMKGVFCALILGLVLVGRGEDLENCLLWMVEDGLVQEIGGGSVRVSELRSRPDGLGVNYARVLAVGSEGSLLAPVYLDLFFKDGQNTRIDAGNFTDVTDGMAGPLWADVTGYEDSAWSFIIELGHFDESGADEVWTPMAYSDRATYEALERFIQQGETPNPPFTPWTGGSYTVPEPTSGLLVVVGGALLALRRRRRAA